MEEWLKIATGTGMGVACMLFGIRWLISDRDKILTALSQERNQRIIQLEESARNCSADRTAMHIQIASLQAEFRSYLLDRLRERDEKDLPQKE